MSFSQALPVGVESIEEQMDMTLKSFLEQDELKNRLNSELPGGLKIKWVSRLPLKSISLPQTPSRVKYNVYLNDDSLNFPDEEAHRRHIEEYLQKKSIVIQEKKKGKIKASDIRPFIEKISLEPTEVNGYMLEVTINQQDGRSLNLWTLLSNIYNMNPADVRSLRVVKTDAQLIETGEYALRNRD